MMQSRYEYAAALFMLAQEEHCTEEISEAVAVIRDAFRENEELKELLFSPAIPKNQRLEVVDAVFGTLHEYAVSFLKILCERRIINEFEEIADEYEKMLEVSQNLSVAKVRSAVALTEEEAEALKKKLEAMCGHTVVLETEVDASVLGGMVIALDDSVIDASLRRRLSDVKEVMGR